MAADLGNIPLNQDNHNGDDVNAGEKHMSQEGNQRRGSDPEVIPIAQQRQYTAEYKRRVLQEYEACPEPGEKEALLHREGLYTSHITTWQRQRERGELAGLTTKKRGPKADPQAEENARLQRENERLQKRLEQAELIIDVQKKVSQILDIEINGNEAEEAS